jgi:peroxiredoxin
MSLQQKLDALRAHLQARTRSDALVAMLRVMEDAVASDRATKALQAPSRAPAFSLPDDHNRPVSLAEKLHDGPVVLVFYRGEWCPWCTQELDAVQTAIGQFKLLGASVLAVSPQLPIFSRGRIRRHKLDFSILHDVALRNHCAVPCRFHVDVSSEMFQVGACSQCRLNKRSGSVHFLGGHHPCRLAGRIQEWVGRTLTPELLPARVERITENGLVIAGTEVIPRRATAKSSADRYRRCGGVWCT